MRGAGPVGREEARAAADAAVDALGGEEGALLPILLAVQARLRCVPVEAQRRVSERTGIPAARVAGVATFYGRFRPEPAGEHRVRVCVGTACYVKGGGALHLAFREALGLAVGEDTDPQGRFTVEEVACLGCCGLAPAVEIDGTIHGHVEPAAVPGLLRSCLAAPPAASEPREPAGPEVDGEARLCLCSSCAASGAGEVESALAREAQALGLRVRRRPVGCGGEAASAPFLELAAGGSSWRYAGVRASDVGSLLVRHLRPTSRRARAVSAARRAADRLLGGGPTPAHRTAGAALRIATEGSGEDDPLDPEAYRARGGFEALRRCREELSPEGIVARVERSGLRGRGGAGYPTGRKWRAVLEAPGDRKFAVCNGDEGDPGAFMDRMLLESFPFRVLEGLAIAARAVGAREAVVYVRGEYALALERTRRAAELCAERRLLGEGLSVRVAEGAGAFVCGEETALLASLEGRRPVPRPRPPFPAESGLWGAPTAVNNVETLALVPRAVLDPEGFAALGTPASPGTKTFALAGRVASPGLVEVPTGLPLARIVAELGGGVEEGRPLKAVQVGGPSGGCVPAALAEVPVDFESLAGAGATMGSGGLVVLDDTDCAVDVARYFVAFSRDESCGRCTFCRVGTQRLLGLLEDLCAGRGQPASLERIEALCRWMAAGSLCGLGRSAPSPVLSTLRHFRHEYEAHAAGRCPAGRCRALARFEITGACIGCTRCAQRCPAGAIPFAPHRRHEIDQSRCTRCGTCRRACPAGAAVAV